ncbi:DUF2155 domain-containing protein [Woodsholea maritima]|uniref:DUF2155 domain-containing protein n=1 Tax=Woodsholea maritima TaxID=240237 RepID=UPI000360156F|nr:DUF2155 domain-containing protein [Woodsholea maritima]
MASALTSAFSSLALVAALGLSSAGFALAPASLSGAQEGIAQPLEEPIAEPQANSDDDVTIVNGEETGPLIDPRSGYYPAQSSGNEETRLETAEPTQEGQSVESEPQVPVWRDPDALEGVERNGPSSQPGRVAILRGLDKVTARTRDFEANVGEPVQFGALEITVQYCRKRPPEEIPEVFVFMEVKDRRTDGFGIEADGEKIFSGWMFASNPALHALEHPIYDVWVMDCRA